MGRFKPRRAHKTPTQRIDADDNPSIFIESIPHTHDDTPALCQIRWGRDEFVATAEQVRSTSTDLFRAAAYADVIAEFMRHDFEPDIITAFMINLLGPLAETGLGSPDTLTVIPAGASSVREGRVLLRRRDQTGALNPDEARAMGETWAGAAENAEGDRHLYTALSELGHLNERQIDDTFAYLRALRTDPHLMIDEQREADARSARRDNDN